MQQQTSVRINERTQARLNELVEARKETKITIIDKAIEEYHKQQFLKSFNEAYAALKSNDEAWETELKERGSWESTVSDDSK